MKKMLWAFISMIAIFISSYTTVHAQSFCKADPGFTKILVENNVVTAMEVTFEPGKTTTMHTHPAFFAYVVEGGKLLVTYADGTTQTLEVKAGDSMYADPERPHNTINLGTTPVKMILVELNEHPYLVSAKMKN